MGPVLYPSKDHIQAIFSIRFALPWQDIQLTVQGFSGNALILACPELERKEGESKEFFYGLGLDKIKY